MSINTRSTSSRATAEDTTQQNISQNRVAGSRVSKNILKPRASANRSILSSIDRSLMNIQNTSNTSATGTKSSASSSSAKAIGKLPQHKMAAVISRKSRIPLSAVDPGRTQVYRDPSDVPTRTRRVVGPMPQQGSRIPLSPKTRPINRAAASASNSAAVPLKVSRSASASNILPTKPISRILAGKPSIAQSACYPTVTVVIDDAPKPLAGNKRRATSADDDFSRVVRTKKTKETSHIERSDSATEVSSSGAASTRSDASQDTVVETHSTSSADSRADSQATVVDHGIPADVHKRKFAKPSRAFSVKTRELTTSSDPFFDFDKDVEAQEKEKEEKPDYDDIDAEDADDPLMVSEYIVEIMEYMHELEGKCKPDEAYMTKQVDLNWEMRRVLINWVVQIHYQLLMLPETLFLAVNLIDRFLSKRQVSVSKLQLVGLTGLLLASKYEEMTTPQLKDFAFLAGNCYSIDEIKNAEVFMFRVLDFDLSYPNPLTFLRRVSKAEQYNMQTRTIAKYLMEVCLVDHRMIRFSPSHIAAAGICMARRMLESGPWDSNLSHYSGYSEDELKPCMSLMADHILHTLTDEFVFKKYQSRRFLKASLFCQEWISRHHREFAPEAPPIGHFAPSTSGTANNTSVSRTSSDVSETF
ncbi:G2/mitotic-specific cyclin [Coemansia sp. IMI 203386]|nr:G2/mitotic-specific cyclin [Coemansia sp. IMI 203386]